MKPDTQDRSRISVIGDATIVRKPDISSVTLFISNEGVLLEDAVRESTTKVEQVQRALREAYTDIRDIHIQDVYIGEGRPGGFHRDKNNPARPEVVKSLAVIIPPNPELAVKIADTAARFGSLLANPAGLHGPYPTNAIVYGLSEFTEAEQEATARAIADAREKASLIGRMLERRIGSVASVSSTTEHLMSFPSEMIQYAKNKLHRLGKYLSVSSSGIEVSARITVTFELLD